MITNRYNENHVYCSPKKIHKHIILKLGKPGTQLCMRMVAKSHTWEHSLDFIDYPEVDLQKA